MMNQQDGGSLYLETHGVRCLMYSIVPRMNMHGACGWVGRSGQPGVDETRRPTNSLHSSVLYLYCTAPRPRQSRERECNPKHTRLWACHVEQKGQNCCRVSFSGGAFSP